MENKGNQNLSGLNSVSGYTRKVSILKEPRKVNISERENQLGSDFKLDQLLD